MINVRNAMILIMEPKLRQKKYGYPFKIRPTSAKDGSELKVDVKCGVHNHFT